MSSVMDKTKAGENKSVILSSEQTSKTLLVFSEGPVDQMGQDLTKVFLNDTPIQNDDGSLNFNDVEIDGRQGTANQSVMKDYWDTEKEIPVGVELKQNKKVVRTITDPNVSKIRVTLGVRGLYRQDDDGSTKHSYAYLHVKIGSDVRTVEFTGKTQEQYLQQIELDNLPSVPFNIEVSRFNEDSTTLRVQNATFWASYTEITHSGLRYPHTALLGIKLNSKTFSNFPRINVLMRGIRV